MAHRDPLPSTHRHRRIQIRGLLWLALLVVIFAIARAGLHTAFPAGWWRLW
ncbi:MAG: hypothetical protein P4L10_06645 [Acidobacteriaceae bacterium]|nr:hypothetical protein [Acidobacteriaceae bacterium]